MLSKKRRLNVRSVLGKRAEKQKRSRFFVLSIFPSKEKEARFAVTASLKVSKKAVLRTRAKRAFYSAIKNSSFYGVKERDFLIRLLPTSLELLEKGEGAIVSELNKVYE